MDTKFHVFYRTSWLEKITRCLSGGMKPEFPCFEKEGYRTVLSKIPGGGIICHNNQTLVVKNDSEEHKKLKELQEDFQIKIDFKTVKHDIDIAHSLSR